MRITVAYDIYVLGDQGAQQPIGDTSASRAAAALESALKNPQLLPEGGVLVFGLQHKYAVAKPQKKRYKGTPSSGGSQNGEASEIPDNDSANRDAQSATPINTFDLRPKKVAERKAKFAAMLSMLKGADATLAQSLADAGLTFEFVAVYRNEDSIFAARKFAYKDRNYGVSRNFFEYAGKNYQFEDVTFQHIPAANVHWVTEPVAWGIENHYISYGNEPEASVHYVSVGIYAYVGPPGARCSFDETTFLSANPLRKAHESDSSGYVDSGYYGYVY